MAPAVNNSRFWASVGLMVAAAVLAVVIGLNLDGASTEAISLARADEIVVEELELGEGVDAIELLGEDGTVIFLMTEEE